MSTLYYLLAAGLLVWMLVVRYMWNRKDSSLRLEEISLNPKVNFGRIAGVLSIQGHRSHMEDAYYGDHEKGFFAVYDGHGGARCSSYAAQHLHDFIFKHYIDNPEFALREGYKDLDHHWLEIANLNGWDDGSTAVSAFIANHTLFCANIGDSRAVLSSSGKAIDMSCDHKPAREDERARIEKLGGKVIHYGTWRVQGVLAVSRAFGDRRLKTYVSAEPEIQKRVLQEGDDFLILASDGLWDVITSQQAVDIVRQVLHETEGSKDGSDFKEAAKRLTNTAYAYHQSMDNITSVVVDLRGYR